MRRPRRHHFAYAFAAVVVAVAACGDDDDGDAVPDRQVTAAETATAGTVTSPASTATATAGSAAVAGPETVATFAPADVVLARDGLGVVAFGEPADDTIAAVTAVLGARRGLRLGRSVDDQRLRRDEARVVAWGSLHLFFSDESAVGYGARHLFAYSYGSVADLEAIRRVWPHRTASASAPPSPCSGRRTPTSSIEAGEEGVLDPSFYVDDTLSGRLTGAADDDLVTVIIGGDPCGGVCERLARLAPRPGVGADRQQRRRRGVVPGGPLDSAVSAAARSSSPSWSRS